MKEEQKTQLARILLAVDEAFLVAMSNKGLFRRAQKDLEGAQLKIEEAEDFLIVRAADWTVWMPPDGPTKARDDTPASGVTRQILSATIYLREHWAKENPSASQRQDAELLQNSLLELSLDDLLKFTGKKLYAEVQAHAKQSVELILEYKLGLTLRMPQQDAELQILPTKDKGAKLLDQILSTAPNALHKRMVLLGILALKRLHGQEITISNDFAPDACEAPRSRQEVLAETQILLQAMLSNGVAHPSARIVERLFTLSLSASAVHLPRLAHLLRSLAEEVNLLLSRDAAADTQRLFSSMSWSYSLVKAIQAAGAQLPRELAGVARTQYDPGGDLRLFGVAAYPWRTSSGYEGLTVLFWEAENQRFLSWSASRPIATPQFDLGQIYSVNSVWTGAGSPASLSRSCFTLHDAGLNPLGRLSASKQSSVSNLSGNEAANLDFGARLFKSWASMRSYAASQFPIGLKLPNPLDRILVLEPSSWGERFYDEMQQSLCWKIIDEAGRAQLLTLPWNTANEDSIEFLESLKPDRERVNRIVCRIVFSGLGFAIEPLSFISKGTPAGEFILNPAFDRKLIDYRQSDLLSRLRKKYGTDRISTAMTSDEDWEGMLHGAQLESVPPQIRNALSETEGLLLQLAESGAKRIKETIRERFIVLGRQLDHYGLVELARSVHEIAADAAHTPERILWTDYLCQLHWQALTRSI